MASAGESGACLSDAVEIAVVKTLKLKERDR